VVLLDDSAPPAGAARSLRPAPSRRRYVRRTRWVLVIVGVALWAGGLAWFVAGYVGGGALVLAGGLCLAICRRRWRVGRVQERSAELAVVLALNARSKGPDRKAQARDSHGPRIARFDEMVLFTSARVLR
jgi:hypothetical protein